MVIKIIKTVLKFILLFAALSWALVGISTNLAESRNLNRINLRFSYPSQQELILNSITLVINTDCEGPSTSPWYCDRATFEIEGLEASHEELFALGKGRPQSGGEFWWLGIKREALWSEIILQDEGEALPICEEVSAIPPDIFAGFFRYCLVGDHRIDRLR